MKNGMMHHNITVDRGGRLFFFTSKMIKFSFGFQFDALKQNFIETLRNHSVKTI